MNDVPHKSVYDKRLSKTTGSVGALYWIMRLMVNEEGTDVITYNELNESMLYKDEFPNFPLEYSPNKLLVTGSDTHMYLVDDWSNVRLIPGTDPLDINKFHAFTIP